MPKAEPRRPLRPLALAVASLFLAASSLLLSAAQIGSPPVSGYGIDYEAK
ncbi:hypothetical protein IHQ71_30025 (plasmid) [Rhizobium sp. TH2]|nr:hypothetical protein [Rhizobium sp. TH2]UVC12486.1 hypothetical protein IHQ71_30025 [Rhizobium sp. TH2]